MEKSHPKVNTQPDIIWKTQLNIQNNFYKDILASIGLDSPITSTETRGDIADEQSLSASLANTPIQNSAISLMALGQHVSTPRHGNIWNVEANPQ